MLCTQARPRLAGIYFSMYVAIVFFVMVNIIIGIITKFFQEVHEETKTADRWKEGAKSFESDLWRRSRRVMLKCCSAVGRCNRKTMDEEEYARGGTVAPVARSFSRHGGADLSQAPDPRENAARPNGRLPARGRVSVAASVGALCARSRLLLARSHGPTPAHVVYASQHVHATVEAGVTS